MGEASIGQRGLPQGDLFLLPTFGLLRHLTNRGVRLANAHSFLSPTKPKTMTHETKTKLKAALATGYIVLTACLGLVFFGRFILAIITN